jgi:hypothetical protein
MALCLLPLYALVLLVMLILDDMMVTKFNVLECDLLPVLGDRDLLPVDFNRQGLRLLPQ